MRTGVTKSMIEGTEQRRMLILGGGAGGCGTALFLAEQGIPVTIIEAKNKLFGGASSCTPGRMGLGFHYEDLETARSYMEATLEFSARHPGFRVAEDKALDDPLRRGRYVIMSTSAGGLFNSPQILKTFDALRKRYAELVKTRPEFRELFGAPENFYKLLDYPDYKDAGINLKHVQSVIETAEHLLDWKKFEAHIVDQINDHPNIEVILGHSVTRIERASQGGQRYLVEAQPSTLSSAGAAASDELPVSHQKRQFSSDYVVNATWQNIEWLNAGLGLPPREGHRTNRLKILAKVKLPESLKDANSVFFCMGPFCMFSNLGYDPELGAYTALMTYAPVTNAHQSSEVALPQAMQDLLNGPTPEQTQHYGQQIIDGVTEFIPDMEYAELLEIRCGIVQTLGGAVDIYDPTSPFHKRAYSGVEPLLHGFVLNPCMKLFYMDRNGAEAAGYIVTDMLVDALLKLAGPELDGAGSRSEQLRRALASNLRQYLTLPDGPSKNTAVKPFSEQLESLKSLPSVFLAKKAVCKELLSRSPVSVAGLPESPAAVRARTVSSLSLSSSEAASRPSSPDTLANADSSQSSPMVGSPRDDASSDGDTTQDTVSSSESGIGSTLRVSFDGQSLFSTQRTARNRQDMRQQGRSASEGILTREKRSCNDDQNEFNFTERKRSRSDQTGLFKPSRSDRPEGGGLEVVALGPFERLVY